MDDEQPTMILLSLPEEVTLLSLPEECHLLIARRALAVHLRSAVRMATCCSTFRKGLQPCLDEASARRLQWLATHTLRHDISRDGLTLTKTHANGHDCAHAAGPLLPTTGTSTWRIRVDQCSNDTIDETGNNPLLGVCDASGRSEWGIDCCTGCVVHLKRNHKGQIVELGEMNRRSESLHESVRLKGRAVGAVIEICVDHDMGTLRFRANDGPFTSPVSISSAIADAVSERDGRRGGGQVDAVVASSSNGLFTAKGLALRPYASLGLARSVRPDRVSFSDGYWW